MATEYPYDLGAYARPVSTTSAEAAAWFDRGLLWAYGFHHEEAVKCFEKAIALDEAFSMAYWGLALALGPNYNKPWDFFDPEELQRTVERTYTAVQTATAPERLDKCTLAEKALILALKHRYPTPKVDDKEQCATWNQDYADAMLDVYESFSEDLDIAALTAEAQMDLTPWALWDLKTGEPAPKSRAPKVKEILDKAMAQEKGMKHPAVLHMYTHLMEMSPTPEVALPAANGLRDLVPDSGHLQHMPTHIDILLGRYQDGIKSNQAAIHADDKYFSREGPLSFYTLYRVHNLHFCIYSAMFAGQSKIANETAELSERTITEDLLKVKSPPMADWLEAFLAIRVHVLIRFGKWDDIVALEIPQDKELYAMTTAMMHYAKAVAHAARASKCFAEPRRSIPG
jgi:tetratricopeptide (TPR) repeat protein